MSLKYLLEISCVNEELKKYHTTYMYFTNEKEAYTWAKNDKRILNQEFEKTYNLYQRKMGI